MPRMLPGLAKHRRTLAVICVAWTLGIALLHFTEQRYGRAELAATDWLTTNGAAHRAPLHPQLVFLALDDASKSLDNVFADDIEKSRALQMMREPFPWNREFYALLIDRLAQAGARAIIFDMLFPAPRFGDKPFREALDRWPDRVVIGTNFKDVADDVDTAQTTVNRKPIHVLPTPVLRPSGPRSWLGFVNVRTDEDQNVRRVFYRTTALEFFGLPPTSDGEELLSLAARGLEKAGYGNLIPATRKSLRVRHTEEVLPKSLYEIFVENQWAAPPYRGGELFKDKIVLIGAVGTEDRLTSPLGTVFGPTIHLNALNAALAGDFIYETSPWENLALIAAAGLTAWLLGARVPNRQFRLLLLAVLLIGYYGGAQMLYNSSGLLPIFLSPMLILGGSAMTWTVFEQALDRREQQRIRRTLERYVSRDAVHEILDNPTSFLNSLGGERRSIAVLFSDIRGFTTMTESTEPQALVAQLNEYFNEMVGIVFAHEGTLDKFIGDAVMAHWGGIATAGAETDARRAVGTALEMRTALARLNAGWKTRGVPELHIGLGVNFGDAIVGNLGCDAKMEVSVLGDAVNLGSRLEGATKEYDLDLCIGEGAAVLVRDAFLLRSVDLLVVKGKTKPVEVFTVLGERATTAEPRWLAHHEAAMRAYRAGDFSTAETAWLEVLAAQPDDPLAPIFLARCAQLFAHPPGRGWTGVFTMLSK